MFEQIEIDLNKLPLSGVVNRLFITNINTLGIYLWAKVTPTNNTCRPVSENESSRCQGLGCFVKNYKCKLALKLWGCVHAKKEAMPK